MEDAIRRLTRRLRELPEESHRTLIAPGGCFRSATPHDTNFFRALTLSSMLACPDPELEGACAVLADGLRAERGPLGTFNYWRRGGRDAEERPYPDDLDTTSCALDALAAHAGGALPGDWVAAYVRVLTVRETVPGGPYRTWVVSGDAADAWQDADPVVNANVGRLLARLDAVPEALERHLSERIRDRDARSPYYPDQAAFRYFLAPWYRGEALDALRGECLRALCAAIEGGSTQTLAFALAAASALPGVDARVIRAGALRLACACEHDAMDIRPEAVCIDRKTAESQNDAGCHAFAVALCREALARAHGRLVVAPDPWSAQEDRAHDAVLERTRALCAAFPAPLAVQARELVDRAVSGDRWRRLTVFPFRLARAASGTGQVYDAKFAGFGAANLFGWAAYTAYDALLDGQAGPDALSAANACMRASLSLFHEAFPKLSGWKAWCARVFDGMDGANAEERRSWRLSRDADGAWRLPDRIPSPSFEFLTRRSCGMLLAPVALVLSVSGRGRNERSRHVRRFLAHVIAARQLCDDAHDWEDDLAEGRLNAASALLFCGERPGMAVTEADREARRARFWNGTLDELAAQVRMHVEAARRHARAGFAPGHEAYARDLLDPIVASMDAAVRERDVALAFLAAYRAGVPSSA